MPGTPPDSPVANESSSSFPLDHKGDMKESQNKVAYESSIYRFLSSPSNGLVISLKSGTLKVLDKFLVQQEVSGSTISDWGLADISQQQSQLDAWFAQVQLKFSGIDPKILKDGLNLLGWAILLRQPATTIKNIIESHSFNLNNTCGIQEQKPLHLAAYLGNLELFKWLEAEGATNLLAQDSNTNTPMHIAAQRGYQDIVEYLLSKKLNINRLNNHQQTPLHFAALGDQRVMVAYLLGCGADLNAVDKDGRNVICFAAEGGNQELVEYLNNDKKLPLQHPATGAGAQRISAPIVCAVRAGIPMLQYFIANTDAWYVRSKRDEMLLEAVMVGNLAVFKFIVGEEAINPTLLTRLLIMAVHFKKVEIVPCLMTHNPDLSRLDDNRKSAIHYAAEREDDGLLLRLLALAPLALVNVVNGKNQTPLHTAVLDYKSYNVKLLLAKRADIEARDNKGRTPLHYAINPPQRGVRAISLPIRPYNHIYADGRRHVPGCLDIIKILVADGANIHALDNKGRMPIHLVNETGNLEILEYLLDHDADINAVDVNGNTLLHLAQQKGDSDMVALLLARNADITIRNHRGLTPLAQQPVAAQAQQANHIANSGYVKLDDYISKTARRAQRDPNHHKTTFFGYNFGYSAQQKLAAARALKTFIATGGTNLDLLRPHEGALDNGELRKIYLLETYIAKTTLRDPNDHHFSLCGHGFGFSAGHKLAAARALKAFLETGSTNRALLRPHAPALEDGELGAIRRIVAT